MTPTDLSTTQGVLDWAQQCEPAESPYGDHRRAQHEGRLQSDIEIAAIIARAMRVLNAVLEHEEHYEKHRCWCCDEGYEEERCSCSEPNWVCIYELRNAMIEPIQ